MPLNIEVWTSSPFNIGEFIWIFYIENFMISHRNLEEFPILFCQKWLIFVQWKDVIRICRKSEKDSAVEFRSEKQTALPFNYARREFVIKKISWTLLENWKNSLSDSAKNATVDICPVKECHHNLLKIVKIFSCGIPIGKADGFTLQLCSAWVCNASHFMKNFHKNCEQ